MPVLPPSELAFCSQVNGMGPFKNSLAAFDSGFDVEGGFGFSI
jgi:hypothetical protein